MVQLSTYSAQDNSQDDVLPVVEWIMRAVGFELVDTVRAGRDSRDMMSMILVRGVQLPERLNERFSMTGSLVHERCLPNYRLQLCQGCGLRISGPVQAASG